MIYITGDMHGDLSRFKGKNFRKSGLKVPKKGDFLIVCGDFGFIWDNSVKEQKALKWINKQKYSTLFIAGTHENFDLLEKRKEEPFCGGMAKTIYDNLKLLSNGYIFNIDGKNIFTFGGGESDDKAFRISTKTWYKQELPGITEIEKAKKRLIDANNKIDFIITHDAPTKIRNFILTETNQMNELHAFFDYILKNCEFKNWFFGKYHIDRTVSKSFTALYKSVASIKTIIPPKKSKKKQK